MPENTLRETITAAMEEKWRPELDKELAAVEAKHHARISVAVDKALAALGEKPKAAAKPRKARSDKGTSRLRRGLPSKPTITLGAPAHEEESACGECSHYLSLHGEPGNEGACNVHGCGCEAFVGEPEVTAAQA